MVTDLCTIAGAIGLFGIFRRSIVLYRSAQKEHRAQAYMWSNIVHMK